MSACSWGCMLETCQLVGCLCASMCLKTDLCNLHSHADVSVVEFAGAGMLAQECCSLWAGASCQHRYDRDTCALLRPLTRAAQGPSRHCQPQACSLVRFPQIPGRQHQLEDEPLLRRTSLAMKPEPDNSSDPNRGFS